MECRTTLRTGETSLELGQSCHYSMPGIGNTEPVEFFRILRIYLFKLVPSKKGADKKKSQTKAHEQSQGQTQGQTQWHLQEGQEEDEKRRRLMDEEEDLEGMLNEPAKVHSFPECFPFVYETFTPEIIREKDEGGVEGEEATRGGVNERLEVMRETFSKVMAFLRNTGDFDDSLLSSSTSLDHSFHIFLTASSQSLHTLSTTSFTTFLTFSLFFSFISLPTLSEIPSSTFPKNFSIFSNNSPLTFLQELKF